MTTEQLPRRYMLELSEFEATLLVMVTTLEETRLHADIKAYIEGRVLLDRLYVREEAENGAALGRLNEKLLALFLATDFSQETDL